MDPITEVANWRLPDANWRNLEENCHQDFFFQGELCIYQQSMQTAASVVENCPSAGKCLKMNVCRRPWGTQRAPTHHHLLHLPCIKTHSYIWLQIYASYFGGLPLPAGGHFTPAINFSPGVINFMMRPRCCFHVPPSALPHLWPARLGSQRSLA